MPIRDTHTLPEHVIYFLATIDRRPKFIRWSILIGLAICNVILLCLPVIFLIVCYCIVFWRTRGYYKTAEFQSVKQRLAKQIQEYNDFNAFLPETKQFIRQQQYRLSHAHVKNSTLTVYKNAQLDPYRYIVKYFFARRTINEETVQVLEQILQKYDTIKKTEEILRSEYNEIMDFIDAKMYVGAYIFKKMTMKQLGSNTLPKFEKNYFLVYSFKYTSPAKRNNYSFDVTLTEKKLQKLAEYLSQQITYRKSARFQRQLMTPKLRRFILRRDNYECQKCHVSRQDEKHLLLEVDHIVPVSKGGITTEQNLRALCWRCNRAKGDKLEVA